MIEFPASEQSGQRGLRGLFAVLFFGALASGPVLQLAAPVPERLAQSKLPEWRTAAVIEGRYARELETHLEERSPITSFLRARFLELELMAGTFEHSLWVMRPGGWMFLLEHEDRRSIERDPALEERRTFLQNAGRRARRLGVRVVATVAPDKVHIYPDRMFVNGDAPTEQRARRYGVVLDDLRDAGFEVVDAASLLRERRRSHPSELLYLRRDTHWAFDGGTLVAAELGRVLRRDPATLGAVAPVVVTPVIEPSTDSHMFATIGLDPDAVATQWIQERQRHAAPWFGDAVARGDGDRTVALCGDSFAETVIEDVLPIVISRPIDAGGAIAGAGPCRGLVETLDRIEARSSAVKTIVWVFVERSAFFPDSWTEFAADGVSGEGR